MNETIIKISEDGTVSVLENRNCIKSYKAIAPDTLVACINKSLLRGAVDFWKDTMLQHGIDEAASICARYLDMNLKREHSETERKFCRELFAAIFKATTNKTEVAKLVYPYDYETADKRMEASYYHTSKKLNEECACAIDAAISASCYKMNPYNLELAAMIVISKYGFERVNTVFAHAMQEHEQDGRYSITNKKWAKEFKLDNPLEVTLETRRIGFVQFKILT